MVMKLFAPPVVQLPMSRALPLLTVLLALLLPAPVLAETATPSKEVAAGQAVYVEWGGSYWAAHVLGRQADGRLAIHYDGWDASWDEVVELRRIALGVRAPQRPYRVGDRFFVEWGGSWWPAQVERTTKSGVGIHYQGYGHEWDEVVGSERILHLEPPVALPRAGDSVRIAL
jgi:hypothetical protein